VNSLIRIIGVKFSILVLFFGSASAQILEPVKWSCKAEKTDPGEATLIMKATIEKGWHLYSQNISDGGPIKTTFTFTPSADYELVGKPAEGKAFEFYDKNFEMQLAHFSGEADFVQKIKISNPKTFSVSGFVEFMVCDDEKCLPPSVVEFQITVHGL
jgi:Disulphide bond corrector protein DsbC